MDAIMALKDSEEKQESKAEIKSNHAKCFNLDWEKALRTRNHELNRGHGNKIRIIIIR